MSGKEKYDVGNGEVVTIPAGIKGWEICLSPFGVGSLTISSNYDNRLGEENKNQNKTKKPL